MEISWLDEELRLSLLSCSTMVFLGGHCRMYWRWPRDILSW